MLWLLNYCHYYIFTMSKYCYENNFDIVILCRYLWAPSRYPWPFNIKLYKTWRYSIGVLGMIRIWLGFEFTLCHKALFIKPVSQVYIRFHRIKTQALARECSFSKYIFWFLTIGRIVYKLYQIWEECPASLETPNNKTCTKAWVIINLSLGMEMGGTIQLLSSPNSSSGEVPEINIYPRHVFKTEDRKTKTKISWQSEGQSYVVVNVNIHFVSTYSLTFFREILIITQFISFTVQFSLKNPVGESYYKMAYFLCTKFDYNYVCLWSPWEMLSTFGKKILHIQKQKGKCWWASKKPLQGPLKRRNDSIWWCTWAL